MRKGLTRRDFFRRIGVGTIGLGFGVSIFDGIYQYANALTEEGAHTLLMKRPLENPSSNKFCIPRRSIKNGPNQTYPSIPLSQF